jgi:hypothetical protein
MTARCIGLNPDGYGRILGRTIRIRKKMEQELAQSGLPIRIAPFADTNIVCFTLASQGESLLATNHGLEKIYRSFDPRLASPFMASKTALRWPEYARYLDQYTSSWNAQINCSEVKLFRLCLMNPFFDSVEMQTNFFGEFINLLKKHYGEMA